MYGWKPSLVSTGIVTTRERKSNMNSLVVFSLRLPTRHATTKRVSLCRATNVYVSPHSLGSVSVKRFCFLWMNDHCSSMTMVLQARSRTSRSCRRSAPAPRRSASRETVKRFTPVRRSVARSLLPSIRDARTAICLSRARMFMAYSLRIDRRDEPVYVVWPQNIVATKL